MTPLEDEIEKMLRMYGEAVDPQGYEVPELDTAKAQILALVESREIEIRLDEQLRAWNYLHNNNHISGEAYKSLVTDTAKARDVRAQRLTHTKVANLGLTEKNNGSHI